MLYRETPVGYALLKAKSSKILKDDTFIAEDESAEGICDKCVISDFGRIPALLTSLFATANYINANRASMVL